MNQNFSDKNAHSDPTPFELRNKLKDLEELNRKQDERIDLLNRQLHIDATLSTLFVPLMLKGSSIIEITEIILEHAKRLTGSHHGYVSYIDPQTLDMVAYTMTEMLENQCHLDGENRKIVFPIGPDKIYPNLWGHSLNTREPFYTNNPMSHQSSQGLPEGHIPLYNFLSFPVLLDDELVGQISISNAERDYNDQDIESIQRLAEYYALAIQQNRTQQVIRYSEEKYRKLFEEDIDGIGISDETGIIQDCNQALCKMVERSREELIGQHQRILHPPEDIVNGGVSNTYKKHTSTHEGTVLETKIITKSGKIRDVAIKANKILLGNKILVQGVFRDITEQKMAARELKEYREHLEKIVEKRTEELTNLNEQLRQIQKMQAIGTLAGGIAHDFNNILSIIIGFTEIAMYKTSETSPIKKDLERIMTASDRAKGLVKQILTFSRKAAEKRQSVFVADIIHETITLLRSTISSNIEIQVQIKDSLPAIYADPSQIQQVIMNLSTNAAYAMKEKGGTLKITLTDTLHVLSNQKLENTLPAIEQMFQKLTVSDTGSGISPEIIQRIFEPYFTSKEPGEGTGLGLAVVHGIVTGHGGEIQVNSTLGLETEFIVYFPESRNYENLQVEPFSSEIIKKGNGERILFVDDEQMVMEFGKEILEEIGYNVTTFYNSKYALSYFEENSQIYDILISDMSMPNLSGLQLIEKCRQIRPDIKTILCTGYNDNVNPENFKSKDIDGFIYKPFKMKEIAEVIGRVLTKTKTPSS